MKSCESYMVDLYVFVSTTYFTERTATVEYAKSPFGVFIELSNTTSDTIFSSFLSTSPIWVSRFLFIF